MGEIKWNEQTCYAAAKLCNSLSEFNKRYRGAYRVACQNGWVEDYKWFSNPAVKWTQTACAEAAKKCKTVTEFATKYSRAYQVARDNGWIETYGFKLKPKK